MSLYVLYVVCDRVRACMHACVGVGDISKINIDRIPR